MIQQLSNAKEEQLPPANRHERRRQFALNVRYIRKLIHRLYKFDQRVKYPTAHTMPRPQRKPVNRWSKFGKIRVAGRIKCDHIVCTLQPGKEVLLKAAK